MLKNTPHQFFGEGYFTQNFIEKYIMNFMLTAVSFLFPARGSAHGALSACPKVSEWVIYFEKVYENTRFEIVVFTSFDVQYFYIS